MLTHVDSCFARLSGGLESGDVVRDYDLKCSFPNAFLQRHPWAEHVRKWIDGSLMQMLPGLDRSAAKKLINSAFGIGDRCVQEWCTAHGLSQLPPALASYLAEIRKGALADMRDRPDIVKQVEEVAGYTGAKLRNAVAYILNSMGERQAWQTCRT